MREVSGMPDIGAGACGIHTDLSVLCHRAAKEGENNMACAWAVRSKEKNIILLSI